MKCMTVFVYESEVSSAASGYFLQNVVLVRKWVALGYDNVGEAVFQVVVPVKFCPQVLKVAHDESGYFGVRKTYLNVLRHFFLAVGKKGRCFVY